MTTDSTSRKPELQMEAPRVVALSEEATCENKDERPSEMSWDVLQRSALSSAMSWGFEYFKNNYVPTEYKEELAKQAFAQTVIREVGVLKSLSNHPYKTEPCVTHLSSYRSKKKIF